MYRLYDWWNTDHARYKDFSSLKVIYDYLLANEFNLDVILAIKLQEINEDNWKVMFSCKNEPDGWYESVYFHVEKIENESIKTH